MNFSTWFLFLLVSLATAFTPGPAVLLAISNSVASGARRAMLGSVGNAAGVFVVSAAAMAGLGVLLKTSAAAFAVLKVLGAAYLIYLGIRQWRSRANVFASDVAATGDKSVRGSRMFANGFVVAVTNPKSILFFTALFPQFMSPENASLGLFLLLTATFSACTVLSHLAYVFLASTIKPWFSTGARARMFNKVSGLTFMGLGVGVLRLRHS
jgi:threonine/homoserine/homoserine lactone efflux protein